MNAGRKPQNTWILVGSGVLALLLIGLVVTLDTLYAPIHGVIRAGALLGYLCVFLAALTSNFMKELTRFFGRSFVKIHHIVAVTGLLALAVHAVAIAWESATLAIFLPRFDSLYTFFSLGGRPAFWLIAVASLTALFRSALRKQWKTIHWLNYLAFILGTIHAWLIGTSFQYPAIKVIAVLMTVALVAVFVKKRWAQRRLKK